MKSKLLTTMVLASSLAFLNCGEESPISPDSFSNYLSSSSVAVEQGNGEGTTLSSGEVAQPESSATVEQGSSEIVPASSADVGAQNPESSSDAVLTPESSADVATSSATVAPESSSANVESSSSEAAPVVSSSSSETKVESSSSEAPKPVGIFLAKGTDETKDQMEINYIEHTGWDGGGILAYPKRLSDTQKHGVVVWGPGGGTEPGAYGGMIRRLTSHGFVVIALKESPGNASQGKPALDWLEKKNKDPNDPLYQKLDMTKVGCSGHSMGGLESEQMVIQDSRVITAMLNNSGDLGHTAMSQVSPQKTIGIVYGEGGMERPNAEADYNNSGVKAPACLIKMTGGQGTECQQGECGWGHGSGPWGGMAATVAWMRWHLGGEDSRKADFVGTSGRYINGEIIGERGHWKGTCKNF